MKLEDLSKAFKFRILANEEFQMQQKEADNELFRDLKIRSADVIEIGSSTITFNLNFSNVEDISIGGNEMLD